MQVFQIAAEAAVIGRVADLVTSCIDRFELVDATFLERIDRCGETTVLADLQLVGVDGEGAWLWVRTMDLYQPPNLIEARIDAGTTCRERPGPTPLIAAVPRPVRPDVAQLAAQLVGRFGR